ncbi:hypothetical protein CN562_25475 [Bacillus wiedmannii]|nr:hypothetical protein [Bacillus wiedmannii]PEO08336.1 hypothetical protein CN562_25475 [Bacillus wiedmannii]
MYSFTNRANNTRIALESIHNNLCNEIDRLCFQWMGASNQQFIQMYNDARPPHTIISNAQNLRRDERLSSGNGKWSSTLQDELKNLVSDFERAGFSKENISETLEQQYKMLDKLKVKYERIDY